MTMDTTRSDITQAVLEGGAFALRDSFEVWQEVLDLRSNQPNLAAAGQKALCGRKIIANVLM